MRKSQEKARAVDPALTEATGKSAEARVVGDELQVEQNQLNNNL